MDKELEKAIPELENQVSGRIRKNSESSDDYLDLRPVIVNILQHIWVILLASVVGFGLTYTVTHLTLRSQYTAGFTTYINNADNIEVMSVNSGDLVASRYLAETYKSLLTSHRVVETAIEYLDDQYTYEQIEKILTVESDEETGILTVSVTTKDPYESEAIASAILVAAPDIVQNVIEGSSMKIIDQPFVPIEPSGPKYLTLSVIGGIAGFLIAVLVILIVGGADNRVKSVEDLERRTNIVVLGTIHDLDISNSKAEYSRYEKDYGYDGDDNSERKRK